MIKRVIKRKLNWLNLEKEVCNESYNRKFFIFGVKVFEHSFNVNHEGDMGKQQKAGFKN